MYKIAQYRSSDLMSDLINRHHTILLLLSRFNIPLGFADKTIKQICLDHQVDTDTFLAVINLNYGNPDILPKDMSQRVSIEALIDYLKNSHRFYLDYRLPTIRQNLSSSLDQEDPKISKLLMQVYDQYASEIAKHMNYEEEHVFTYVFDLLKGNADNSLFHIRNFSEKHTHVEEKLDELRDIIIRYYPTRCNHALNCALFDLFSCAEDLSLHNEVEDRLFVPAIELLEKSLRTL